MFFVVRCMIYIYVNNSMSAEKKNGFVCGTVLFQDKKCAADKKLPDKEKYEPTPLELLKSNVRHAKEALKLSALLTIA